MTTPIFFNSVSFSNWNNYLLQNKHKMPIESQLTLKKPLRKLLIHFYQADYQIFQPC